MRENERLIGEREGIRMTLRTTPVGKTVRVTAVNGQGPVKRRIMEMGVTRGTSLYVSKVAPFGDPVEVSVRGYELTLRREDAEMIEVELV